MIVLTHVCFTVHLSSPVAPRMEVWDSQLHENKKGWRFFIRRARLCGITSYSVGCFLPTDISVPAGESGKFCCEGLRSLKWDREEVCVSNDMGDKELAEEERHGSIWGNMTTCLKRSSMAGASGVWKKPLCTFRDVQSKSLDGVITYILRRMSYEFPPSGSKWVSWSDWATGGLWERTRGTK
jgi:hypothetical protein